VALVDVVPLLYRNPSSNAGGVAQPRL